MIKKSFWFGKFKNASKLSILMIIFALFACGGKSFGNDRGEVEDSFSIENNVTEQGDRQPPDLSEAAEKLGVSEDELQSALGSPPPDFEAAADKLGVSVEELKDALPKPPK